ncbi:MAG: hypothetical protein L6W00_06140 [Lentisphaeria bacterium]|nr:MAG: hypothetical protein L6W00_06140 [Lentisphaeria bacterium]
MISPLFQFLGISPGYDEIDVSGGVLVFFTIFYAMIIGDAGYGLVFLLGTLLAKWKFRNNRAAALPLRLMTVLSIAAIVWGRADQQLLRHGAAAAAQPAVLHPARRQGCQRAGVLLCAGGGSAFARADLAGDSRRKSAKCRPQPRLDADSVGEFLPDAPADRLAGRVSDLHVLALRGPVWCW